MRRGEGSKERLRGDQAQSQDWLGSSRAGARSKKQPCPLAISLSQQKREDSFLKMVTLCIEAQVSVCTGQHGATAQVYGPGSPESCRPSTSCLNRYLYLPHHTPHHLQITAFVFSCIYCWNSSFNFVLFSSTGIQHRNSSSKPKMPCKNAMRRPQKLAVLQAATSEGD